MAPPRNEHRHPPPIIAIEITEIGDEIAFLESGAKADPRGPEGIEQQAVGRQNGSAPQQNENAGVKRMSYPAVRPAG